MFLNKIPRILINCHNKINNKYTRFRAYSLYRMFWLKKNFKDLTVKPQAYTKTRPNFRGLIRPLDPKRAALLDQISTNSKKSELDKGEDRGVQGLINKHDIAKFCSKTPAYVLAKLRLKGIKPVKRVSNIGFYKRSAMDIFN